MKLKVTEYWQHVLAEECSSPDLTSLRHFDPYKASLLHSYSLIQYGPVLLATALNAVRALFLLGWLVEDTEQRSCAGSGLAIGVE